MIEAKVIADSISPREDRLTTIECKFPRFILSEVNTHRMISKSAQSSRAIPISNRISEVRDNPAMPVHWGKNQRGMVAEEEIEYEKKVEAMKVWFEAAQAAADYAEYLASLKIHKQVVSRVLEPFLWQTNVMTSTDFGWQNLLRLRDHPDAQPEFQALAKQIRIAYEESEPKYLEYGEWHLPYISDEEFSQYDLETIRQASVARVARTSYGNANGFDIQKDLDLYKRLIEAEPRHDAPLEMVAMSTAKPYEHIEGNFKGWSQLRHTLFDNAKKVA